MANALTRNIPNAITCCNLVSGCVATYFAFDGLYRAAFLFIVIGAVFDFFDGMSARLLGVSSPIGKELDSLADDVTFGVAPSAMIFTLLSTAAWPASWGAVGGVLPYAAFIMAAFSALRLAKFNLDERQSTSFIGLPTPANTLFWASLIVGAGDYSGLKIIDELSSDDEQYAIGFRKGDALRDRVNEVLEKFIEDGTTLEIAEKYGLQNALITDYSVLG